MKNRRLSVAYLLIICIPAMILAGCPGGESQTDNTQATSDSLCGDGICDEVEQKNPELCPADCAADGTGSGELVECEPSEWTLTIEGCSTTVGTEPSADLCMVMAACITVDESCNIQGTGSGRYTTCGYTSPTGICTYDVQCPDFTMPISGEVVLGEDGSQTFRIIADSSGIFEDGTATCAGITVPITTGSMLQDGFGSATRNGNGYLCEIVADPEGDAGVFVVGQDALVPNNLSYDFYVNLYPDCQYSLDQLFPDHTQE